MRFIRIAAAAACLALPAVSSAQPASWMFEGVLDGTGSDPAIRAAFPAGQKFRMHMTYDRSVPEEPVPYGLNPDVGHYLFGPNEYDLELRLGGRRYTVYSEVVFVRKPNGVMENDGSLTESLTGDPVGSAPVWKPHWLDWSLGWPGFPFPSDAMPGSFPHSNPSGSVGLNFRTCANTAIDPCPGGNPPALDRTDATITSVKRVVPRRIRVFAGPFLTWFAIFGQPTFLPDVQIDRTTIELSMATPGPALAAVDINLDGHLDLVGVVRTSDVRRRPGETTYRLIAQTINGHYVSGIYP